MVKYANELKEVYVILNTLVEEDYNKIPKITIKAIEENMNDDYEYEIDEDIELRENPMLPGTKEILFNIFRDYLATDEQREKIKKKQQEDRLKLEKEKQERYNIDIFAKERETNKDIDNLKENEKQEETQMIEYKESIFKKIINFIKSIFGRK